MQQIRMTDMTLHTENGAAMSFKEKVEIARLLDRLRVDVIALAPIVHEKADSLLVSTVASFARDCVIALDCGMTEESVDIAWKAVSRAAKPRLRVVLPVSVVQMEYHCHLKPAKMLALAETLITKAKSLCGDVEFCALDATRGEDAFLDEMIACAVRCGANSVTLCDDAGAMLPDAFGAWLKELTARVPALQNVTLGVIAASDYRLAEASAVEAVRNGAGEIMVSVGDEKRAALDVVGAILHKYGDTLGVKIGLDTTQLTRTAKQIGRIINPKDEDNTLLGGETLSGELVALQANDPIETVMDMARAIGYDLSEEDSRKVYEEFLRVAQKKAVGARELDAIIASSALQVPPTYQLESYNIHSGNVTEASAHIKLLRDGVPMQGICLGDGPIDASFATIESIIGHHYELDDFQIQSITEGQEAIGTAVIKLRDNGKLYAGNGISTDIIGASIRAYLSALNKIVFEEKNV